MNLFAKGHSKKNGFTLIEVTIVIFIILMMTSAVVPWMKTFAESTKLRSVARSMRNLMDYARTCAITERTEYVVLFDPENSEYWLSLKALLSETTGGTIVDESRTSLSESLEALAAQAAQNEDNSNESSSDEDQQSTSGSYSRTGGLLGIPRQLPKGVQIVQIRSSRTSGISNSIDYVSFNPDSTAETFEVYLQGSTGKVFLLSVMESTGMVSIRELKSEEIEELGLTIDQKNS